MNTRTKLVLLTLLTLLGSDKAWGLTAQQVAALEKKAKEATKLTEEEKKELAAARQAKKAALKTQTVEERIAKVEGEREPDYRKRLERIVENVVQAMHKTELPIGTLLYINKKPETFNKEKEEFLNQLEANLVYYIENIYKTSDEQTRKDKKKRLQTKIDVEEKFQSRTTTDSSETKNITTTYLRNLLAVLESYDKNQDFKQLLTNYKKALDQKLTPESLQKITSENKLVQTFKLDDTPQKNAKKELEVFEAANKILGGATPPVREASGQEIDTGKKTDPKKTPTTSDASLSQLAAALKDLAMAETPGSGVSETKKEETKKEETKSLTPEQKKERKLALEKQSAEEKDGGIPLTPEEKAELKKLEDELGKTEGTAKESTEKGGEKKTEEKKGGKKTDFEERVKINKFTDFLNNSAEIYKTTRIDQQKKKTYLKNLETYLPKGEAPAPEYKKAVQNWMLEIANEMIKEKTTLEEAQLTAAKTVVLVDIANLHPDIVTLANAQKLQTSADKAVALKIATT